MRFMRHLSEPASLFDMPEGRPLRISDVQGSPDLRSKLYAMGLLPGTPIKICNRSCGQGSLCVRVKHCSLVIGEALARAIICRADICHGHGHGMGHGHGIGRLHGHGRDREICAPEGGSCPNPEGVDIMAVRECSCPDNNEGGGGLGGKGHEVEGHGAGEHGAGGHGASVHGGRGHGSRWRFFAS